MAKNKSMYKKDRPLERRKAEALLTLENNPGRVPVIVEKAEKSKDLSDIVKKKYLVPRDMTVGQFMYTIRRGIKLDESKAIFVFVDNLVPPNAALMSAVYEEHKDEDGFLYMCYSGEDTFGSV